MALDLRNYEPAIAALGIGIQAGSGAPSHSASLGTLYINTAGSGVADRAYLNTDGATTWTSITTAA